MGTDSATPYPSPLPSPGGDGGTLPFTTRDAYTRQGSDVNLPLLPLSTSTSSLGGEPSSSSVSVRREKGRKTLTLENDRQGSRLSKGKDGKGAGSWYGRTARSVSTAPTNSLVLDLLITIQSQLLVSYVFISLLLLLLLLV